MFNPNNILALLGILEEKVVFYDIIDGDKSQSRLFLELVDERPCCPNCGLDKTIILF